MQKRKQYDVKIIKPHTESAEIFHSIGKGKNKGIVICPICEATYYKKSWHNNLKNFEAKKEDLPIKFVVCPADSMIKNKQFEGEITITNIPDKILNELKNLILAYCERAYQKDNQHRLIALKNGKNKLVLTTTENQLAVKLAKKIKETFKKVEIDKNYSPAPSDVVYIKIFFK